MPGTAGRAGYAAEGPPGGGGSPIPGPPGGRNAPGGCNGCCCGALVGAIGRAPPGGGGAAPMRGATIIPGCCSPAGGAGPGPETAAPGIPGWPAPTNGRGAYPPGGPGGRTAPGIAGPEKGCPPRAALTAAGCPYPCWCGACWSCCCCCCCARCGCTGLAGGTPGKPDTGRGRAWEVGGCAPRGMPAGPADKGRALVGTPTGLAACPGGGIVPGNPLSCG